MKITICGSISFFDEMNEIKSKLEKMGHKVKCPLYEIKNHNGDRISDREYYEIRKKSTHRKKWVWEQKGEAIKEHFRKVMWSDVILVVNHDKGDIKGYIGPNTLMEMGLAFFKNKKIFLYNKIPNIPLREEVLGLKPIVIDKNLKMIR